MSTKRWLLWMTCALCACGGSSSTPSTPSDGGGNDTLTGDTTVSDSSGDTVVTPDAPATGTSIKGSVGGKTFDSASMSLWIGAPDDSATTVVYVFSKPVKCSDLASPGWDTRITDGTQFLEMKMIGTKPADYKVVSSPTPAPGEATVNYTLSSTKGTPAETTGSGGTVTLTTVNAGKNVTGSFSLTFGSEGLSGTYDAAFCPGGHEP